MTKFKELLQSSIKSSDTEESIDMYFTRPVGLVFALFWIKLRVHPNVITVISIFLGIGAAWMFHYTNIVYNIYGILLLILANFCDSTDGQMARLTGQKTLVGRVLDGFSGDVWFFCIYVALCIRMQDQMIPFTGLHWGVLIWILGGVSGFLFHTPQSSLSDYYRQIHLFFLKGKSGSELDSYKQQRTIYEGLPKHDYLARLFYWNYSRYCKSQERRTPKFQAFFGNFKARYRNPEDAPKTLREEFLKGSKPLMKYTNMLTFNVRAICLYATCLLNIPWVYFLIEITALSFLYFYMHRRHEALCVSLNNELK